MSTHEHNDDGNDNDETFDEVENDNSIPEGDDRPDAPGTDDRPVTHEPGSRESAAHESATREAGGESPQLADLIRQAGQTLRREFFAAMEEADIDPREFAEVRRRAHRRRHADVVDEGTVRAEENRRDEEAVSHDGAVHDHGAMSDGAWGDDRVVDGRSGAADDLRERIGALRDQVSSRIEDVLDSEELESLTSSLKKIVSDLAPDAEDAEALRDRMRDFARGRGGRHGRRGDGRGFGSRGGFDPRADSDGDREAPGPWGSGPRDFGPRDFGPADFGPRRGGRGSRRGFGPRRGFDPRRGFGPRGGFDPRGGWDPDCDPREFFAEWMHGVKDRGREEAFERGFAAGFAQGRES